MSLLPVFFLRPLACLSTRLVGLTQMMLADAGRAQEALELDATLLGYLRDDSKAKGHDVLEGTTEDMLVSATK